MYLGNAALFFILFKCTFTTQLLTEILVTRALVDAFVGLCCARLVGRDKCFSLTFVVQVQTIFLVEEMLVSTT